MSLQTDHSYTAFVGPKLIAAGKLSDIAVALHGVLQKQPNAMPLIFDDTNGSQIEMDLRGTAAAVKARYLDKPSSAKPTLNQEKPAATGRGRPRLGVVAREVTLLPEHWEWLAAQPGGASVALRKLVHEAKRGSAEHDRRRHAHDRSYKAMHALAGNLPGFEEASRALFAGELERLTDVVKKWPSDIRKYVIRLANSDVV